MKGFMIIPVSLQLLVENALKHNAASRENPLGIRIYPEDGYMVVSNTINRKNLMETQTQTGLSNLGERVRLILGKELVVQEENSQFVVKIPVVPV
jgi:two-component system LytT family sensor kinase